MFLKVKEIIKFAKVQKSSSSTATTYFQCYHHCGRVFRFYPRDKE